MSLAAGVVGHLIIELRYGKESKEAPGMQSMDMIRGE